MTMSRCGKGWTIQRDDGFVSQHRQDRPVVCRGALVVICIVEVFHVIPPLGESSCDSGRLVWVLLDVVE